MSMSLEDWLGERHKNCLRLAERKVGAERDGWLEDATYFKNAINAVGALRAVVSAWQDPGPMGTMMEMPRAVSYAKNVLGET